MNPAPPVTKIIPVSYVQNDENPVKLQFYVISPVPRRFPPLKRGASRVVQASVPALLNPLHSIQTTGNHEYESLRDRRFPGMPFTSFGTAPAHPFGSGQPIPAVCRRSGESRTPIAGHFASGARARRLGP